MANNITTSGLASGTVSTPHQSGQSVSEWVEAHCDALDPESPAGDELVTEWTSAAGKEQVATQRNPGESDEELKRRHQYDFLFAMIEAPPIP